jgi:isopentenyl phosphate kinase
MLPGYNHNIVHKGITFHVQTEDNGIDNPFIVTHLFIGGNIVATKKTSYMDIIKVNELEKIVADIMKEQHKKMILELRDGLYDSHALVQELLKKQTEKVQEPIREEEKNLNIDEETKNLDEVILDYLVETSNEK